MSTVVALLGSPAICFSYIVNGTEDEMVVTLQLRQIDLQPGQCLRGVGCT
ncbi:MULTISPECIES: hypothetical protein [Nostoc]|uniref:Uncharacterized protein n=2 Tax=Nostoc TaxID=1177 RepID=A0ABR8I290_9NOSO|nr:MULTISPECIES: hypothetical protein [Nostoc]MBD2559407.1 hypothetical protein [Nostoc linckia FACHB-391]MBD2645637.1 hypothetical protein [Nostoc foliaceum FACHB-393]